MQSPENSLEIPLNTELTLSFFSVSRCDSTMMPAKRAYLTTSKINSQEILSKIRSTAVVGIAFPDKRQFNSADLENLILSSAKLP
ncbi:MAG: hypothetical protein J2P31_20885 [Blastocatellia bacterium]|nr:hypothetical protein [Blastocatellia bacterium]